VSLDGAILLKTIMSACQSVRPSHWQASSGNAVIRILVLEFFCS